MPVGLGITQGGFGGEAESCGDVQRVAAGGASFLQDAVLAEMGGGGRARTAAPGEGTP